MDLEQILEAIKRILEQYYSGCLTEEEALTAIAGVIG